MKKVSANKGRRRAAFAVAVDDSKEDRISKLPEPILHHILCFLSQRTAAKTSVLSKSWRYLWCTRPKIDFHDQRTVVAGENKEAFLSVLDRTLRGYRDRDLDIKELTIQLSLSDGETDPFLRKWIWVLVQVMGVNQFHLLFSSIDYSSDIKISLPLSIFRSESIRDLSLESCALKSIPAAPPLHLIHLRGLSLDNVDIPEEILDGILSNCRFIESVSLEGCTGFKRIQLKHPANLKEFYCNDYHSDDINISLGDEDIPIIRSIEMEDCVLSFNSNRQFYFSQLTNLTMTNVTLSCSDLFSCSLPCLEELKLKYCSGIKEFNLSSPSMKRLEITNTNCPFKVTVDAPSIVTFRYKGLLPQSISFSAAPTSWKSYIELTRHLAESSLRLKDLIGLLKALSQSQISVKLLERTVRWLQNQVDDNMNDVADLPVAVDHLIVADNMRSPFLDSLFLVLRPRFLYMNYIKALAKTPRVTEVNLKQRDLVPQLFSERVSTQVVYWNTGKWIPFEPVILSKLISKKGEIMDQTFLPSDMESKIKLVIFDLDRASICYRKFIRSYLALCY